MRTRIAIPLGLLAGLGLLVSLMVVGASPSFADDSKDNGFILKLDPLILEGLNRDLNSNSSKFEEYSDESAGFRLRRLYVMGEDKSGNRTLKLRFQNAGRNDARYALDYGVSGRYSVSFDYNQIPHNFGNDGHMLWSETSPGHLEIADGTQGALQAAILAKVPASGITFSFLRGLLNPYLATANRLDLGLRRDRALARLDIGKMSSLAWAFEITDEKRHGNRPFGGSFGFSNATEVPEPIDYTTSGATLAGEWKGRSGGLNFGYKISQFKNDVSTLYFDNPFRLTDGTDASAYSSPGSGSQNGAARGFADLAADNRSDTLFLNGRTKFGSWWAHGNAAYTRMRQDDPLLPYTLNSSIVGIAEDGSKFDPTKLSALPHANADTKVNTLTLNGDIGTKFAEHFALVFRYRYYDYDDQSRREDFPGYVRFHAVWEAIGRVTVPFSHTRSTAGADLSWAVSDNTGLNLSFEHNTMDRKFREIGTATDDVFKLTGDTHPFEHLNVRAAYEHGDRTTSHYDVGAASFSFIEAETPSNLPDLRKYDEAPRTYDSVRVMVDVPYEKVTFSFAYTDRKDDYKKSLFGLVSEQNNALDAEVDFTPGGGDNLYLFGTYAQHKTFQRNRQSGATPSTNPLDSWSGRFHENNSFLGLGWRREMAKKWTFDLSGKWSKSDGKADLFSPPGGTPDVAVGFDNYEDYDILTGLAQLDYALTSNVSVGVWYRYEKYSIDSFNRQGLDYYLPATLLLNANNGDFRAHVVALRLKLTL